jgi:hypothetical protein
MLKYLWLLVLAVPPWAAAKFDAPKWIVLLAVAPFLIFAMTLGDPEEDALGEASGKFRKPVLVVIAAGGLALGTVVFLLWRVFFA